MWMEREMRRLSIISGPGGQTATQCRDEHPTFQWAWDRR
jgi:hypothetical protein